MHRKTLVQLLIITIAVFNIQDLLSVEAILISG